MELENTITINNFNINSFIWGFIDSKSGKLILYPKNVSNKIENNYQDYLKKDAPNKINIDNKFNIHFNKNKEFSETTDTSYQSVFRENISKLDPTITIMKSVYFNENYNDWLLKYPKYIHISILFENTNIKSNRELLKRFIIQKLSFYKQKNIMLYISYFTNKFQSILSNLLFLEKANDKDLNILLEKINKIPFDDSNLNYCKKDSILKQINIVNKYFNINDEVYYYLITESKDNFSFIPHFYLKKIINIKMKKYLWKFFSFSYKEI